MDFKDLLLSLLTPSNIAIAVSALGGLVALLVGSSAVRRRRVALAVYHAFNIVEDIAKETPGEDIFDKASAGLKAADEYMKANGWRPLKPGEQDLAGLTFKSLNAQKHMAEAGLTTFPR